MNDEAGGPRPACCRTWLEGEEPQPARSFSARPLGVLTLSGVLDRCRRRRIRRAGPSDLGQEHLLTVSATGPLKNVAVADEWALCSAGYRQAAEA